MRQEGSNRGRLIGRYVVHDRLAAGGMATVHIGRLLGAAGFSRTVAIKRLHDAYAKDPEFVAMLLDEARIAALIRHPNVVPTLDVVAEEDELLVVMEYVEGDSVSHLAKLLHADDQRVPIAFAAGITAQALHGLHAAHGTRDKNGQPLGIVHRDVSPQNILVGIDGVARVLDFGIAKAASRATATEDGQIKGKTAYMAPEQLANGAIDARTDVFAASVMLWELLTNRRLFAGNSPAETIARVLTLPIERPDAISPEVPKRLADIVMRGLERDAARRFASAEEMALALEEASPPPRAKDVGIWVSEIARSTLESRVLLVQEVEQSSHKMPVALPASSSSLLTRAIEEAERRRHHAEMPTDVGAGPSSTALRSDDEPTDAATVQSTKHDVRVRPGTARARARTMTVLAIGLGALILFVVLAFVFGRGRRELGSATTIEPVAAGSTAAVATTTTSEAVAGMVSASAAPSVPRVFAATTALTAATASAKPNANVRVARPAPRATDCTIPFSIDAAGKKHFKPECVSDP